MTDEKPEETQEKAEQLFDPPHPLDGGALHGADKVPEHLTDAERLMRLAAQEEHQAIERERGRPPFGKL